MALCYCSLILPGVRFGRFTTRLEFSNPRFEKVARQTNLMGVDFAVHLGDIVTSMCFSETFNTEVANALRILKMFEVPCYLAPGNHDIANKTAQQAWRERHGATYYYFVYKNVLFMVLDSEDHPRPDPPPEIKEATKVYKRLQVEDPAAARAMLAEFMGSEAIVAALGKPVDFPDAQVAWIEKTLAENADSRWTFLFMHEPCWENPSESFKTIEGLLKDRSYTFFGGHLHYYDYDNIDGRDYITMGPAGASWHHEGEGNVDHIMWVTMTDDGPQMGNIALKGLFDRRGLDTLLFGAYDRKGVEAGDTGG